MMAASGGVRGEVASDLQVRSGALVWQSHLLGERDRATPEALRTGGTAVEPRSQPLPEHGKGSTDRVAAGEPPQGGTRLASLRGEELGALLPMPPLLDQREQHFR